LALGINSPVQRGAIFPGLWEVLLGVTCACRINWLGFADWQPFIEAANVGNRGFGAIPTQPGVYCIRAAHVGEVDLPKILENYRRSPIYQALGTLGGSSESFFQECGFGSGWGWRGYITEADGRLSRIGSLRFTPSGELVCPILYIGCSGSLQGRLQQLMWLEHTANHPIWALLFSKWGLEFAYRVAEDQKSDETALKLEYCQRHEGRLPPLMDR
jgi:hypothetical protein